MGVGETITFRVEQGGRCYAWRFYNDVIHSSSQHPNPLDTQATEPTMLCIQMM